MAEYVERAQESVDATASEVRIAPLDRLQVPQPLDGSLGVFRCQRPGSMKASTDVDAVRKWLCQYEINPSTHRSYQAAVERLINWTLVERRKALSSLDDADLIAFEEFLADPQPRWRWISSRSTARSDPNWTPLVGPLSPRSRLHTLVILRVMFNWLNNKGYCDVGRSLWRHSTRSSHRPSGLRLAVASDTTPKVIGLDDWHLLQRSFNMESGDIRRTEARLAVELMYYGGLSVREVGNVSVQDVTETGSAMLLYIPSRAAKLATIYLVPPVAATMSRVLETLGVAASDGGPATGRQKRETANECMRVRMVSRQATGALVKSTFRRAAELAASEGNMVAAGRLAAYSSHSLRHAFEFHAKEYDDANWIWLLTGAARLVASTTRLYLRRQALTDDELQKAYQTLAPCWNVSAA